MCNILVWSGSCFEFKIYSIVISGGRRGKVGAVDIVFREAGGDGVF
jgi:hypothetical protein